MLATGIPILQALNMITDSQKNIKVKSILKQISLSVETGQPLSLAMKQASSAFDELLIGLVITGEKTGQLSELFERIATYREKEEQLKAKVHKAMIYPVIVLSVAFIICYLMLSFVIPEFESMFNSFGAELPKFTQQVLQLSYYSQTYGVQFILLALFIYLALKLLSKRSPSIQLKTNQLYLRLPILGNIFCKADISKFSRTLATSFSAGLPILEGLDQASQTAMNLHYQIAIEQASVRTATGIPIHLALQKSDAFPDLMIQMIMIGEESGTLDKMLTKLANMYEFEVDNSVDNLGKAIEPFIMLFLGVIIGGLVVAIYLPIFNLVTVLE